MEDVSGPVGGRRVVALVRGEVRGPDGSPAAGARVVVTASPVPMPDVAAVTDAAGHFSFAAPSAGRYEFAAHLPEVEGPATGEVVLADSPQPPEAGPPPGFDRDADVGSEDEGAEGVAPPAPPPPAGEVRVVLTVPGARGGEG